MIIRISISLKFPRFSSFIESCKEASTFLSVMDALISMQQKTFKGGKLLYIARLPQSRTVWGGIYLRPLYAPFLMNIFENSTKLSSSNSKKYINLIQVKAFVNFIFNNLCEVGCCRFKGY